MKTKALYAALLFAAGFGASTATRLVGGTKAEPVVLEFQNAKLVVTRAPLTDGGISRDVAYEACGYLTQLQQDGGATRLGEPCWRGQLPEADVSTLAAKLLAQYDAGR